MKINILGYSNAKGGSFLSYKKEHMFISEYATMSNNTQRYFFGFRICKSETSHKKNLLDLFTNLNIS